MFFALSTKTHLHFSLSCLSGGSSIPRESLMAKGKASSATGCPAAAAQPPLSPLSASCAIAASSGLQPPHAQPTSSTSQPSPSSLPLPDGVGQTPKLASDSDPRVELLVGQPLPMFPSTLIPPLLLPTPPSENPAPLDSFSQQTPRCSSSASAPGQEQLEGEGLTDCHKTVMSNARPTVEKPFPINVTEEDQNTSACVATEYNDGMESDASVEIVEPSSQRVMNLSDSDRGELIVIEPSRESISRESSTAGMKMSQQKEER